MKRKHLGIYIEGFNDGYESAMETKKPILKGSFRIQGRRTGKTSEIIEKFLGDPFNTHIIVSNSRAKSFIEQQIPKQYWGRILISFNSIRCYRFNKVYIDDYLTFDKDDQRSLWEYLPTVSNEIHVLTTESGPIYYELLILIRQAFINNKSEFRKLAESFLKVTVPDEMINEYVYSLMSLPQLTLHIHRFHPGGSHSYTHSSINRINEY